MMKRYLFIKFTFISLFLIVSGVNVQAQQVLTLEEAVSIGLEKNYGLQISRNLQEEADNNRTIGNAGFLPTIDVTAGRTESIEDSEFRSADGTGRTNEGARSTNTNAAVNLNWTIFDGLTSFARYDRLGKLKEISDEELRFDMEFLVSQIALSYFNIIRISEQIKVLENNIEVSLERIEIEETKVDLGSGSEYDLLQARSDLNADRAAFIRERNQLNEAKISLNELLSRDPRTEYDVTTEIDVNRFLPEEELYNRLMEENAELSIARFENEVSRIETREIQGERYPQISLTSGYSFNRSENDGGFFQFNETTGLSVGLTARVNIFNGFNINRRVQNAQIRSKNAELNLESQKLRLESEFQAIYRTYQNSIQLVDLEEENLSNAEETLDIALERFRLGSISSLEFREAQRTFIAAENRLINAKFEAKVAETELLQLTGEMDQLFTAQ
ncbi:TolC family protein [Rhodohalobacter barkolensis]|uniref:TolC family protein n=1 Tax=Rhodohalobacter barkolensis TaxID=2053187 RepID=A0A2N0VG33_9BACT|nr:TolC family protein [Rhodohalobacter barkolensis]PKD43145.1 TolC family protein [Rhodohalobacter barkolensis]